MAIGEVSSSQLVMHDVSKTCYRQPESNVVLVGLIGKVKTSTQNRNMKSMRHDARGCGGGKVSDCWSRT